MKTKDVWWCSVGGIVGVVVFIAFNSHYWCGSVTFSVVPDFLSAPPDSFRSYSDRWGKVLVLNIVAYSLPQLVISISHTFCAPLLKPAHIFFHVLSKSFCLSEHLYVHSRYCLLDGGVVSLCLRSWGLQLPLARLPEGESLSPSEAVSCLIQPFCPWATTIHVKCSTYKFFFLSHNPSSTHLNDNSEPKNQKCEKS